MGHGTVEWRYDQQDVLDAILADVDTGIRSGRTPRPDAVLCTGDIANTGAIRDENEYDQARDWLERLLEASGAKRISLVPGNHDIGRTFASQRDAWRLLEGLRERGDSLDAAREYVPDRAALDARLARYSQFCGSLGVKHPADTLSAWSELVVDEATGVRLIGLNSASLCNDETDRGKLLVTEAARTQARRSVGAGEVALVLMHHPLDWLASASSNSLTATLETMPQIVALLHGHIHQQAARRMINSRGDELLTVSAGAVHDDQGVATTHAYSVGAIRLGDDGTLCLRYWPRRYERQRFHVDVARLPEEGPPWVDLTLPSPEPRRSAEVDPAQTLIAAQLRALGARRTAFPTDLTIDELRERGLLVPARLQTLTGEAADVSAASDVALGATAALVLGPPGAGKTVVAYEVAHMVSRRGAVPLVVDVRSPAGGATTVAALLAELGAGEELNNTPLVVIADGLDEALAAGLDAGEVTRRVRALASLGGLIATCRDFEYDSALAAAGLTESFAAVYRLLPWRPEQEFAHHVARLVAKGLLPGAELVEVVTGDERLRELVARPLHARMLTYVAGDGALPADRSSLYSAYLGKLSARAALDADRAGCRLPRDVMDLWRETAWVVHESRLAADDVPIDGLIGVLGGLGVDPACAWRILSPIIDADRLADNRGAFVHFSFYEHLVAQRVHRLLSTGHASGDGSTPSEAFAIDLPQEIRRHLTALLRRSLVDAYAWPAWLAVSYQQAAGEEPTQRTVRNMIAYVACRLDVPFDASLRPLLAGESDKFLRNSLMWALVRGDNRETLSAYIAELEGDAELRALNRGYLLYYFGDLPRTAPPYPDDDPSVGWEQTRRKVSERLADDNYARLAPARRVIDLYTFADLARARSELLTPREAELLDRLTDALPADMPDDAVALLRALLDRVRS